MNSFEKHNRCFTIFLRFCHYQISLEGIYSFLAAVVCFASFAMTGSTYAAAPTAVSDERTVPVNTSITLNPIANDYDSDGDDIVMLGVETSSNASVSLNSDGSVSYSPKQDFQGVDTFTYTIEERGPSQPLTATGTVTITVANSNVVTASEGENSQSVAVAVDSVCATLRESSESELSEERRSLLKRCEGLEALSENNPDAANKALLQIAPEETISLMRVAAQSTRVQTSAISQRMGQLAAGNNHFTLNGIASLGAFGNSTGGGAGDAEPIWSALGFFASFQHEVSDRDVTALEAGYKSRSNAITVGADYRLNEKWVVGGAVGFSETDLNYSLQGGSLDSELTSFIIFNSYSREHFSLETQLGYVSTAFDSTRNVKYSEGDVLVQDSMVGSTGGAQLLFNSQLQWDWVKDALSVSPLVRFDYVQNKVKGYGENGDGGLPMSIGKQFSEQLTFGAGVQCTYVFNQDWGVLIPLVKLTFLSEINSKFDPVVARFAYDPDPENTFTLQNDGEDNAFWQLGVGSSFVFKAGLSGFIQIQQTVDYRYLSAYQVQGGVRYEF